MADLIRGSLSRSGDTFRAALLLSVLLHLLVILYLKLPGLVEPMRGKVALSVILAQPQEVGPATAEPLPPSVTPVPQQAPEVPALPPPEVPAKHEEPPPPPIEVAKPVPEPESVAAPAESLQQTPADPVEPSLDIVEAGKVQALLMVDESGAVHQIIWQELPAVTDKTLQRMEQHLRDRNYLATGKSYIMYEIVEIPRE
jgi:hypothetical protein